MASEINVGIEQALQWLKGPHDEGFEQYLTRLSEVVKIATNSKVQSLEIITCALEYLPQNEDHQLRVYRGILLVVRNLAPSLDVEYFPLVIQSFHRVWDLEVNEWVSKLRQVYWEILANFQRNQYVEDINSLFSWSAVEVASPVIHLLFRQFYTEDEDVTNENLLHLLRIKENNVLREVHRLYTHINFDEVDHDSKMLIHLLYDLVTHESFAKWINQQSEEIKIEWLELTAIVIQTKDDWNNFQLVGVLVWVESIFSEYSLKLDAESVHDEQLERILSNVLQIFSELAKFKATVQYFEHSSNFLPQLMIVFKVIHENVKRVTMKSKVEEVVNYSHVKSYIIIILSYYCYKSFKNQELVRDLGGLALVLSNCVIDENNPFIKEQAILCVKYLLDQNPKNQQFVANLEAKKTVDDSVLQEVGYKVDIVDGKVNIHKQNSQH